MALRSAGLAGIALVVILALSTIVSLRSRHHAADSLAELQRTPSLLKWRSPTDFLLQTPGHELRDSLPEVGQTAALIGNINQGVSQSRGERR